VTPPVFLREPVQPRLVERLEGQHPGRDLRHVLQRLHGERVADLAEEAGGEPRAEDHEDRYAVRGRGQEHRPEQRDRGDHHHAQRKADAGGDRVVGPPVARDTRDHQRRDVDADDIGDTHQRGSAVAAEQQAGPSHRSDDDRLEQAALGVATNRAEREEHAEHRAEEQRGEHRQPEQRGAHEHALVQLVVRGKAIHLVETDRRAEPVEAEEPDGEHEHHEDHAPAHRLAQGIAGHDQRTAHAAPTASR